MAMIWVFMYGVWLLVYPATQPVNRQGGPQPVPNANAVNVPSAGVNTGGNNTGGQGNNGE